MKHVGKHENRKCVVIFREVPDEEHMCLVTYTDVLPRLFHDGLMKVVESPQGQEANEISEPMSRHLLDSGENLLQGLHTQGFIRKVQNNHVYLTPDNKSAIRLDELNKILKDMKTGEAAKERIEEMKNDPAISEMVNKTIPGAEATGILSDSDIAKNQLSQAEQMRNEANRLLDEAANLEGEAYTMDPSLAPAKKRGRPSKVKSTGNQSGKTTVAN